MKKVLVVLGLIACFSAVYAQKSYVVDLTTHYVRPDQQGLLLFVSLDPIEQLDGLKGRLAEAHLDAAYRVAIAKGATDSLLLYVALDTVKQEKFVVVDENRNSDFSDDKRYVIPFSDYKISRWDRTLPTVSLPYKGEDVLFDVDPFESVRDPSSYTKWEYYLQAALWTRGVQQGVLRVGQTEAELVRLACGNKSLVADESLCNNSFTLKQRAEKNHLCDIGKPFLFAGRMMRMDSVQGSRLYLSDLGAYADSTAIGSTLPHFTATDPKTKKQRDIRALIQGKHVLLDFWGSWCAPCVAALPKVVELYEKVKDRSDVAVVGLALERPGDLAKMQATMERLKVAYPNYYTLWDDKSAPFTAPWVMKVQNYPTYIVVDKSGKIVFNTNKEGCDRDKAIEFFEQLIK